MVRIITVDDIRSLIHKLTLESFFKKLMERQKQDFKNWHDFELNPRLAVHIPNGVLELMPVHGRDYFSFKYVNGHPQNPLQNKMTVTANGMLIDSATGYPLLISEMTVLTACRTASTSALASQYLARKNSKKFGIIGVGAQAEFQVIAHQVALGMEEVFYFDIDPKAMKKFENNLKEQGLKLIPCKNAEEVVSQVDIVTTATAEKKRNEIIKWNWLQKGTHINGIGGDCPGKTEMSADIVKNSKVVVELLSQSSNEGEIQHFGPDIVHAELWELISGKKSGRENNDEITLFDSVGIALEDYSVLRLVYALAEEFHVGHMLDMVPDLADPKDLFGVIK